MTGRRGQFSDGLLTGVDETLWRLDRPDGGTSTLESFSLPGLTPAESYAFPFRTEEVGFAASGEGRVFAAGNGYVATWDDRT